MTNSRVFFIYCIGSLVITKRIKNRETRVGYMLLINRIINDPIFICLNHFFKDTSNPSKRFRLRNFILVTSNVLVNGERKLGSTWRRIRQQFVDFTVQPTHVGMLGGPPIVWLSLVGTNENFYFNSCTILRLEHEVDFFDVCIGQDKIEFCGTKKLAEIFLCPDPF